MPLTVTIKTIPHEKQAYPTTGDWHWLAPEQSGNGGPHLMVTVSDMGSWRYEALVGVHEVVEALICRWLGIKDIEVDAFDIQYEADRTPGSLDEPGDDANAPYYFAHQIATGVERTLAAILNVDWNLYEWANNRLYVKEDPVKL